MTDIPLLARKPSETFARQGELEISVAEFCGDIRAAAAHLAGTADPAHIINLCQDRYLFSVVFFAALANGQTNLLPTKRDDSEAMRLQQHYPRAAVVRSLPGFEPGSHGEAPSPACDAAHTAAIVFTSGSTGAPQPQPKSWQMLDTWRRVHYRYLPQHPSGGTSVRGLVATVPSWHMYGLEWAMLLPTLAPLTLHCGADFYPHDVSAALAQFDGRAVLVSTPVHLRALVKAEQTARNSRLSAAICATAPLDEALARQVEAHFAAPLCEIYGCSEIGSLACRYPGRHVGEQSSNWRFFDCFDLSHNAESLTISHPLLPAAVTLADAFTATADGAYQLLGRTSDIIKVGGKRESLANLNNILTAVPGVDDGIFFQPRDLGLPDNGRLAALVVAPQLDSAGIRNALARQMDAAFLPRPIHHVHQLPRDATSKLKHEALAELVRGAANMSESA